MSSNSFKVYLPIRESNHNSTTPNGTGRLPQRPKPISWPPVVITMLLQFTTHTKRITKKQRNKIRASADAECSKTNVYTEQSRKRRSTT